MTSDLQSPTSDRGTCAIIAGSEIDADKIGAYMPALQLRDEAVATPYGEVIVHRAQQAGGDLVFLNRHGPGHANPPHRINHRANLMALHRLGVQRILAAYAVGSINPALPPLSLALLEDFLDFSGQPAVTFFDGGATGLAHTIMSPPYCPTLGSQLLELAARFDLVLYPRAVYASTKGPRFETPAEIRALARLGADVVGMTGAPEATLARELGIHFAGVAFSINWAAGIESSIHIVRTGISDLRQRLLSLFITALASPLAFACACASSVLITHPPQPD